LHNNHSKFNSLLWAVVQWVKSHLDATKDSIYHQQGIQSKYNQAAHYLKIITKALLC